MKLVTLYSNKPDIFPPIRFRDGLNVIFAQVNDPQAIEKDSHNLGKTFLIRVIDFALICNVKGDHPFKINPGIFDEFVFYLEIQTNDGNYVTVRRAVSGRNAISIYIDDNSSNDLSMTCPPKADPHTMLRIRPKETGNAKKATLLN